MAEYSPHLMVRMSRGSTAGVPTLAEACAKPRALTACTSIAASCCSARWFAVYWLARHGS